MTPNPFDTLTDDERLLLRLAGELPPDDRAAKNGAAAPPSSPSSESSRALLDAWSIFDRPLADDAASISLPSADAAARAVVRAMRNSTPAAAQARRRRLRLRPPGWALYPAAAAALLAMAMVGWWYKVHDEFAQTDNAARPDVGPPVLVLRGNPDEDLSTQSDGEIAQQFDSMIVGRDGGTGNVEWQFAALDFLEKSIQ